MTEYKPGTVAKATVRGVPDVQVTLDADGDWCSMRTRIEECYFHDDDEVTDVRPLVVLDLGPGTLSAREAVAALRKVHTSAHITSSDVRLFEWLADQIEAQTRPAIEEPKGLGAVVEDEAGTQFVKVIESTWVLIGNATHWTWDQVHAVRVLSEGVKP